MATIKCPICGYSESDGRPHDREVYPEICVRCEKPRQRDEQNSPFNNFMAMMQVAPEQITEYDINTVDEMGQICRMHLDTPATITRGRDSDGWTVKELQDVSRMCNLRMEVYGGE